jgi:hypothetical protein
VLDDFGYYPVDEFVVELDAALPERLRKDVVHERGLRLVAPLVAHEGVDRGPQILIVEQREERDSQVGARSSHAGGRRRESRILDIADPHA